MNDLPTYILERTFNAPCSLVWKTWTDPELVPRWYGPGVDSLVHRLDAKPGGLWLHEMKWGGNSNYQRAEYLEVVEPERLVWIHTVCDEDWNIAPNPMMPDWPKHLLTTVTFEPDSEQTKLRLTWTPHEAGEAEIACFAAALEGLDQGWGKGMELLASLLEELQA